MHSVMLSYRHSISLFTSPLRSFTLSPSPGWKGERETKHKVKTNPQPVLQKISFSVCAQTLIRNLRDSSTRDTLARPALWQMDTVLVDQAVEKFNLKKTATTQMKTVWRHLLLLDSDVCWAPRCHWFKWNHHLSLSYGGHSEYEKIFRF